MSTITMKMAKASLGEIQQVLDFANHIEEAQGHRYSFSRASDEECAKLIRNAPPLFRVAFGYVTLLENCCDPDKDTLEFKPEILKASELLKESQEREKKAIKLLDNLITYGAVKGNHMDGYEPTEQVLEATEFLKTYGEPSKL